MTTPSGVDGGYGIGSAISGRGAAISSFDTKGVQHHTGRGFAQQPRKHPRPVLLVVTARRGWQWVFIILLDSGDDPDTRGPAPDGRTAL